MIKKLHFCSKGDFVRGYVFDLKLCSDYTVSDLMFEKKQKVVFDFFRDLINDYVFFNSIKIDNRCNYYVDYWKDMLVVHKSNEDNVAFKVPLLNELNRG